ncbi:MAG TPA: hypothetical protein VLC46_24920 [Thermoanaerobaculia bacterium]|jgi:hypothetical protein|nr:hypothetical protein [Thermoanaerobaculia bacterium]
MTVPKIQMVNAVTMEHGRQFAQYWFEGNIDDACDDTDILTYPGDDPDQQADCVDLQDDITGRVFEAVTEQIAEAFVRIANAVIEEERTRAEELQGHAVLTAIFFEEGGGVTGFVEEFHGISAHGKTLREARARLTAAAREFPHANREGVRQRSASYGSVTRERLIVEITRE